MAQADPGTDGAYRMTIENRYKQLANVRRDSKLLAALGVRLSLSAVGLSQHDACSLELKQ